MTVEGQAAILEEAPIPAVIPDPADLGCTIAAMPGAPVKPASTTPARIEIPRWMQLVGLPLMLVLIWVVASAGFGLYVANYGSYNKTYGSLGAVIILLLWFYVTGLAFLVGGQVNATIEHAAARQAGSRPLDL